MLPILIFPHFCCNLGFYARSIDYLLTWNYAHLANPIVQERLVAFCRLRRLRAPLLVSPESILSVRLGQTIRRRD